MRIISRRKRFVTYALFGVALVAIGALSLHENRPWQYSSADIAPVAEGTATLRSSAQQIDMESAEPSASQSLRPAPPPAVTDSENENPAASNPSPVAARQTPDGDCDLDIDKLIKAYDRDIKRATKVFESTLAYPTVGSMIKSRYIDEHNAKISSIYGHYSGVAAQADCSLPIRKPEPLPAS